MAYDMKQNCDCVTCRLTILTNYYQFFYLLVSLSYLSNKLNSQIYSYIICGLSL